MKRKILISIVFVVAILQGLYIHIAAQSYYMHEAAEDSDGNPVSGIVALLIIIGIGALIDRLFNSDNDSN